MWARIILRSADAVGGLESATGRGAWLDEAGQPTFTVTSWQAVRRRVGLLRGRILLTTTLYDLGFLDTEIIPIAKNGGTTIIEQTERGEIEYTDNEESNIALVQFDSTINPLYSMEEYDEARSLMSDYDFNAFYRGRRITSSMMVYDCFDKKLNTIPRFPIPDNWPRFLGADFGAVNTATLHLAQEPGTSPPRYFIYRGYKAGGKTGKQHAIDVLDGEPMKPFAVGGAGSEDNWRLEFAAGGLPIRKPDITEVDLQISSVYAGIKSRRLIFMDDLLDVLQELRSMRYKRDRDGNKTEKIENESSFHYMAALRYIGSLLFVSPIEFKIRTVD